MSETAGTYLASPEEQDLRHAALLAASEVINKMRIGPAFRKGGKVEIDLRLTVVPGCFKNSPSGIEAFGNLEAEYDCFLDGFGPFREKVRAGVVVPIGKIGSGS